MRGAADTRVVVAVGEGGGGGSGRSQALYEADTHGRVGPSHPLNSEGLRPLQEDFVVEQ